VQPTTLCDVPPLQVSVALPETVHAPSHVMLQIPEEHRMFEPAPTVCVHNLPAQVTLQFAPQVPVQVAPLPQVKLQPVVEALHASKPQA
jgi:hypothetical protein